MNTSEERTSFLEQGYLHVPGVLAGDHLRLIQDEFDREIQPERDLWQGIERAIVAHPQKARTDWTGRFVPMGVAASLVIATAALVLAVVHPGQSTSPTNAFRQPISTLQDGYINATSPAVQRFTRTNRDLDPATLDDLYRNFEIMENARRDIERQLKETPNDQRLLEMRSRIREQELALLRQNYTKPGLSM